MMEDLFLQADVDELSRMCDLEEPDDSSVTTEALKYVWEWRAVEYVKDLNSRLGVAPSTEDILRKVEENRVHIPEWCRPGSKGTAAETKARMWAKRFRARWGGRYGRLRIADDMVLAEMQQKVQFSTPCVVRFWHRRPVKADPFLVPDSGPENGSRFRTFIVIPTSSKTEGSFLGPESGTENGSAFSAEKHRKQAHAVWQWYNCCAARVPAGRAPLRINLDETSVALFQGGSKGTIMYNKRKDPPAAEPHERASRAKRRTCLTHVAFICDRADIQPSLPQVLVGNEATFLAGNMATLRAGCPPNVHLERQKSAWNNKQLMMRIITMLAVALRPHLDLLQPILLLDTCRVHIAPEVLNRCLALRIWPVVVPARLTWLLQPCDTHAFLKFKQSLRKAYQAAHVRAASRELSIAEFLPCLYSAIRQVLQGNVWGPAFDADGFGQRQQQLSSYVQRQLQIRDPLSLPDSLPSEELLKHCFPRRAKVPSVALLRPLQPAAKPAALPKPPTGIRLALGSWGPASSAKAAPAVAKMSAGPGPSVAFAKAFAGREPRTRGEHRLAEALAKGRPVPK